MLKLLSSHQHSILTSPTPGYTDTSCCLGSGHGRHGGAGSSSHPPPGPPGPRYCGAPGRVTSGELPPGGKATGKLISHLHREWQISWVQAVAVARDPHLQVPCFASAGACENCPPPLFSTQAPFHYLLGCYARAQGESRSPTVSKSPHLLVGRSR